MLVKDVEACSFANWYDKFKKVTFKSIVVPVPHDVLAYLRSDDTLVNTWLIRGNLTLILRLFRHLVLSLLVGAK